MPKWVIPLCAVLLGAVFLMNGCRASARPSEKPHQVTVQDVVGINGSVLHVAVDSVNHNVCYVLTGERDSDNHPRSVSCLPIRGTD